MIMKKIYLYILVCVLVGYSCDDMNDFEQGILKGYVLDAVTGEGLADVDECKGKVCGYRFHIRQ